jgi:hypothetical protein
MFDFHSCGSTKFARAACLGRIEGIGKSGDDDVITRHAMNHIHTTVGIYVPGTS